MHNWLIGYYIVEFEMTTPRSALPSKGIRYILSVIYDEL